MPKPSCRAQCKEGQRPCPWISCKHHLIWVDPKIKKLSDDDILKAISEMPETCVLDIADEGGTTLNRIGKILKYSKHACRQGCRYAIKAALEKINENTNLDLNKLKVYIDGT